MAAASSKVRAIAGSFGKRISNQIWPAKHLDPALFLISSIICNRRTIFSSRSGSHYDKEIEEQVSPVVVPDHVIGTPSENYWGPNPTTGVFGPADPKYVGAAAVSSRPDPPESGNGGFSALDQTVRFRHLELEDLVLED